MSRVNNRLALPTTLEGIRANRKRAAVAVASRRLRDEDLSDSERVKLEGQARRLQGDLERAELEAWQAERSSEGGQRLRARNPLLRRRADPIGRLLAKGALTLEQANLADAMLDASDAFRAERLKPVDLEAAGAVAARDPLAKWSRGRSVAEGEGAPDGMRAFGFKRVKAARSAGDGLTDRQLDALQASRSLARVLDDLKAEANRSRDWLGQHGPRAKLPDGWVSGEAYDVLCDLVFERISFRACCQNVFRNYQVSARSRCLKSLLQGLDYVAQSGVVRNTPTKRT